MKTVAVLLCAVSLGACVPAGSGNNLAALPREQVKDAATKAETPAGISTVEFKELGETRRAATVERIIRATWDEACRPTLTLPSGYAQNGASQWTVRCNGSLLKRDYMVLLPERANANARVLKCYEPSTANSTCDVIGRNLAAI